MNKATEPYESVSVFTGNNVEYNNLLGMVTDHDENVFICGEVFVKRWFRAGFDIVKFDSTLNFIKYIAIGNNEYNIELHGMIADGTGIIFVCGEIGNHYNDDFYIAKLDGNLNLVKQIAINSGKPYNRLYGVTVDSNGNVIVCGSTNDGHYYNGYIAKFDNDLNPVKQITIDDRYCGDLYGIAVDSNDNIFVCGATKGKPYVAKLDNKLNVIKQISIDIGEPGYLNKVTISSSNNVFIGGIYDGHIYVARFDDDLNLIKQVTINTGTNNSFYSFAVNSYDDLFIYGRIKNYPDWDFYIAKLDNELFLLRQAIIDGGHHVTLPLKDEILVCRRSITYSADNMLIAKFDKNLSNPSVLKTGSYTFTFSEPTWLVIVQDWPVITEDWVPTVQNWAPRAANSFIVTEEFA